ncbi:UNVERIFIED_CONTAM: hypothetical protein K2H54_075899 [Gekko kuhli]
MATLGEFTVRIHTGLTPSLVSPSETLGMLEEGALHIGQTSDRWPVSILQSLCVPHMSAMGAQEEVGVFGLPLSANVKWSQKVAILPHREHLHVSPPVRSNSDPNTPPPPKPRNSLWTHGIREVSVTYELAPTP